MVKVKERTWDGEKRPGMASILLFQESIFSSLSLVPRINPSGENWKEDDGTGEREHITHMHSAGRFTEGTQHTDATRSTRTREARCDTCEYASCDLSWSPRLVTPGRQMTWPGCNNSQPQRCRDSPSIPKLQTRQQQEAVPCKKCTRKQYYTDHICMHTFLK